MQTSPVARSHSARVWWNVDRRRHIAQLADADRRHLLDEDYVVDALARQLEEIRNLPEVAC